MFLPGAIRRRAQPLDAAFRLMGAGVEAGHQRFERSPVALQHAQRALQPDRLEQGRTQQHDKDDFEQPFHAIHRAHQSLTNDLSF